MSRVVKRSASQAVKAGRSREASLSRNSFLPTFPAGREAAVGTAMAA